MRADVGSALVARIIAACLAVVLVVLALWYGFGFAHRAMFRDNEGFILRNLVITTGNTVTGESVRRITGVREGLNLFSFDLAEIRDDFLRNLPNVRDIRLERRLPDGMSITVQERMPAVRRGRERLIVADLEGYVFSLQREHESLADLLPVLASEEWANLEPGKRLGGRPRAALAVLDTAESMRLRYRIEELDTTGPHNLLLITSKRLEIALPWRFLTDGDRTVISGMLHMASEVLDSPQAAVHNRFEIDPEAGRVYARSGE